MKIDGSLRGSALTGATNPAPARATNPAPDNTQQRDSVNLSNASSQIQALETSIKQAPDFDAAKVEAVKKAISEGRFEANPEKIANGLLASARELTQPKSQTR
jgi:negative regulator of flagellin synthesis FlgM